MGKVKKSAKLRLGIIFCFYIIFLVLHSAKVYSQIFNDVRAGSSGSPDLLLKNSVSNNLKDLPLTFRKNMGQWDDLTKKVESKILYSASSPGWDANVYFMKDKLSFGFMREWDEPGEIQKGNPGSDKYDILVWNLHFIGANPRVKINEYGCEKSNVNYFLGSDPSKYAFGVTECRTIEYKGLYTGVDLRYYTSGKEIKYDYIVNNGANIGSIKMGCEGIKKLKINAHHQLEVINSWGTLIEEIPESYQVIDGERREVKIGYVLQNDTTFGFEVVGSYDRSVPLIIDPVILKWSTWVGGSNTGYLFDIALDAAGYVYGTGWYFSSFPVTAGSYDVSFNGGGNQPGGDAFVFKMKPDATGPLVYSTYLGGSSDDYGNRICVDNAGNAYVTGYTASNNFPATAGSFDNSFNGGSDVFVTKLNPAGSALVYSTYLGGTQGEAGNGIAVNAAGEAFVTGKASSQGTTAVTEFPTTPGAYDRTTFGVNVFVTRFNAAGTGLIYSTFIGGFNIDYGNHIAIGAGNIAYVTGAASQGFPTTPGTFDATFNDAFGNGRDAFFATVNATGTNLLYSTYLGGTGTEEGVDIAVGTAGDAYITGYTKSNNFPIKAGAYSTVYAGADGAIWGGDVFVSHIQPGGLGAADMIYSTFIGGGGDDVGGGIAINSKGEAYIAGFTSRESSLNNFPTTACTYRSYSTVHGDHFVCKLSANGSALMYSTLIGGEWLDYNNLFMGIGLIEGCGDEVVVGGTSHSPDYPTTPGVFQPTKLNNSSVVWDQPITFKLAPKIKPGFLVSSIPLCKTAISFTDTTSQCGLFEPLKTWLWDFGDGATSTLQNPTHIYNSTGTYQVKLVLSCPKDSVTKSLTVTGTCTVCANPPLLSSSSTPFKVCGNVKGTATVTVNAGTGTGPFNYSWSNGQTTQAATGLLPGIYTVTTTDLNGCSATRLVVVDNIPSFSMNFTSTNGQCERGGSATAFPYGGTAPYTFSWSNSAVTAFNPTALPAGSYTLMVTDANGCTLTKTFTITDTPNLADASFTQSPAGGTICASTGGTTVAFTHTGSAGTYSWTISAPANVSGATADFSYKFLSAGTYTITHTTTNSGCWKQTTSVISVINCSGPTVTATGKSVCPGSCATITSVGVGGTAPYTYSWSSGATTQNINSCPGSTTTYTVKITDNTGATSTSTAVATVNPAVTLTTASSNITCNGSGDGTAIATGGGGTPPYTYNWSTGKTTQTITGLTAGNYTVTVTDAKGCNYSSTASIINPLVLAGQFAKGTAACSGCGCKQWVMINATGGTSPYSYSWPDGYIKRYKNQLCPGNYSVNITDKNGCSVNINLVAP